MDTKGWIFDRVSGNLYFYHNPKWCALDGDLTGLIVTYYEDGRWSDIRLVRIWSGVPGSYLYFDEIDAETLPIPTEAQRCPFEVADYLLERFVKPKPSTACCQEVDIMPETI